MSIMEYQPPTMTRGDLKPDLQAVLGDDSNLANFSAVTADLVHVIVTMNAVVLVDDTVDEVTPSGDGKTLHVRRAWEDGETDLSGRAWVSFRVDWLGASPQHFPEDTPLMMHFRPAPGEA